MLSKKNENGRTMSQNEHKLDFENAYKVEGYDGIAWRIQSYEIIKDEDYEWSGITQVNRDRVVCYMIGDDREFTFDVSDLTELDETEYCTVCGQIGCNHNF
jgi:hypothetical protein